MKLELWRCGKWLAGAAVWLLATNTVWAGVVGSQHDLTAGGTAQGSTALTDEVCVFCHTPHGSDTAAPVPLWNKILPAGGGYTQYSTLSTPTFDANEELVGSVSLACLSCHDGAQAMDVVLNKSGTDGYVAAGSQIDPVNIGVMTRYGGTDPIPMLGTDLTDDHPISMQYGAGGPTSADADGLFAGTLGDPDFNDPYKDTVNTNAVWWVDSPVGVVGTREKTDMVLYSRDDTTPGTFEPFVECGSCHDPHNDATKAASSVAFLRISNTASRICTTCHIK